MEGKQSKFSFINNQLLIARVIFGTTLLTCIYISFDRYQLYNDSKEKELSTAAILAKEKIIEVVTEGEQAANELSIEVQQTGSSINFETSAKQILELNESVKVIGLVEGETITHIYPLKGNEKAIGLNLFKDSLRNKEVFKSLETKSIYFAGPYPLIQGGRAIIGRLPIYIRGNYFGLVTVLIPDSIIISKIQSIKKENHRLKYQISKINPNTGKEEFFLPKWGDVKNSYTIAIPQGDWKIYVQFEEPVSFIESWSMTFLIFLLLIICCYAAWYLVLQPLKLKRIVADQTRQIEMEEIKKTNLFEQASDAFFLTNLKGQFISVNQSACEMLEYTRKELLKMSVSDCIDPTQLEVDPIALEAIISGKHNIRTRKLIKKSGVIFEVESNTKRVSDDVIFIIARDLSDIRKAERKIAASESILNSAFDNSPISLALLSQDLKWLKVNKSLCEIFGFNNEDLVGFPINSITYIEDHNKDRDLQIQLLKREIEKYQINKRFIHKNGKIIWANLQVTLGDSTDDQPLFFIVQIEDVTAKNKAEEEILRLSRLNNFKSKINELLLTNSKKDQILKHACNIAVKFGEFRMAWVGEFDEEKQIVVPVTSAGFEDDYLNNLRISTNNYIEPEKGPIEKAIKTRTVQCFNDISNNHSLEWREEALKRNFQSAAAIPIIVDNKMIAIIAFYMPDPFFFNEAEIVLLQNIADSISFGLDKLRIAEQQKKTEIELRQNVTINKAMINAFPDSIFRIKENGEIVFVHSSKDINKDSDEYIGKSLQQIYPEQAANLILSAMQEAFQTKNILTIEFTLESGNSLQFFEGRLISVDLPTENQALLILRDITESKDSEQSLKNSLKLVSDFRYAMDQSSMVDITDKKGQIIYVNDNFCKATKYSKQELVGQKHKILNANFHSKAFFKSLKSRITQGYVWQQDVCERAKDGSFLWVDLTIVPFLDNTGKPYQFISFRKDISNRKRIEVELKGSEEKFRTVVEQSLLNVFIFQGRKLIYVNPRFSETIGYTKEELLNDINFLDLIHPKDRKMIEENFQLRISGGYVKNHYNFKAIKKNGDLLHIEIISSLIEYNGEPAIIGTAIDVTEKVMEESKLARAVSDAQENERMLIGMELHDNIKQLLAACNISISLAQKKIERKENAEDYLNQASEILQKVMTDLRYLSHQLTPLVETDLPLVDSIKMLAKSMNLEEFSKLTINCNQNNVIISKTIYLELYRILQEQITNIIKYSKANNVYISVQCNIDEITLIIKDDGKGFDIHQKEKGIGLENIRRRAMGLNGHTEIISSIGKGSEIIISIPL